MRNGTLAEKRCTVRSRVLETVTTACRKPPTPTSELSQAQASAVLSACTRPSISDLARAVTVGVCSEQSARQSALSRRRRTSGQSASSSRRTSCSSSALRTCRWAAHSFRWSSSKSVNFFEVEEGGTGSGGGRRRPSSARPLAKWAGEAAVKASRLRTIFVHTDFFARASSLAECSTKTAVYTERSRSTISRWMSAAATTKEVFRSGCSGECFPASELEEDFIKRRANDEEEPSTAAAAAAASVRCDGRRQVSVRASSSVSSAGAWFFAASAAGSQRAASTFTEVTSSG
ncbi:hypothetical protein TYRP_012707 [Tyrophagus putrescentiae]|nr:hypothetical protein TYRP_012707 [Tyrophagus putrescentiae]